MNSESARSAQAVTEVGLTWAIAVKRTLVALAHGRDAAAEQALVQALGNLRVAAGFLGLTSAGRIAEAAEAAADRMRETHGAPERDLLKALGRAARLLEFSLCTGEGGTDDDVLLSERDAVLEALSEHSPHPSSIPAESLSDVGLFLSDSDERLRACGDALSLLGEPPPRSQEAVNAAFRAIHTFKGNAAMMGYEDLESVARATENALEGLRAGELVATAGLKAALARLVEKARQGLASGVVEWQLERDLLGRAVVHAHELSRRTRLGEILVQRDLVAPEDVDLALSVQQEPLGQALVRLNLLSTDQLKQALELQIQLRAGRSSSSPNVQKRERFVSVELRKLERLAHRMRDVSTAAASLEHLLPQQREAGLGYDTLAQAIHALARDLASTSRVALKPTFARLARLTRQLAEQQGKLVQLTIAGAETEVDREQVEPLTDALMHVVRNALDHGIEKPSERASRSKPERATLVLRATPQADRVVVEVEDDGSGFDFGRIGARAVARGLASAARLSALAEQELVEFLFAPGFTTRDDVSDVSGRGVGLDAARQNILELGGGMSLTSRVAGGVRATIELPIADPTAVS